VAAWTAEVEQQRNEATAASPVTRTVDAAGSMTAEDIACLVAELGDIATALGEATPEHKLDPYRSLRLKLAYSAETQTVHAAIDLGEHPVGIWFVSQGPHEPLPNRGLFCRR